MMEQISPHPRVVFWYLHPHKKLVAKVVFLNPKAPDCIRIDKKLEDQGTIDASIPQFQFHYGRTIIDFTLDTLLIPA